MILKNTLLPAVALALLTSGPALAAGPVTEADNITCTPDRMGHCKKDGTCEWRTASERAKAQLLIVDFNAKKAFFRYKGKNRGGGYVLDDKMDGDARSFVISKDKSRKPRTTMELTLGKDGKLTGSRNNGQVKIEATCKAS
jgi:hypothetical protein